MDAWTARDYVALVTAIIIIASGLLTAGGLVYALRGVIKDVDALYTKQEEHSEQLVRLDSLKERFNSFETRFEESLKSVTTAINGLGDKVDKRLNDLTKLIYDKRSE